MKKRRKRLVNHFCRRALCLFAMVLLCCITQGVYAQKNPKKVYARASQYSYLPSGYTRVGNTQLYYKPTDEAFDMIGYYAGYYYSSTYNDRGYRLAIQIDEHDAIPVDCLNGTTTHGVSVHPYVEQQGELARVCYLVTNDNESDVRISMGVHADVMIGNNDSAPISRRIDTANQPYGLTMKNGNGAQLCVLFGSGLAGVTAVNDYWFGKYSLNFEPYQMVGNYSSGSNYMQENGSYDSGMGWCWKNRTITAGTAVVFSYLIGVGEVNLEPNSSFEVTPDDPEGWNDLTRPHKLALEGIYESPAGLDGMIEYAVEESEDWQPLTEMMPSGGTFRDTLVAMFNIERERHIIRFRTKDNVGNTTLLPSIEYIDVSFHQYSGIVDKIFTGDSIYQEVKCIDYPDLQITTGNYNNNVNAGTASFFVEGVFPYTIGRKPFTFQITPAPLVGSIDLVTESYVYDGQQHYPEWSFTNETYNLLEEGKDYNVIYSDNRYPGTAKVTVRGKGNYTSELTKSFFIDKAPLRDELFSLTLPDEDVSYDGNEHKASATANNGVGEITFTYTMHGESTALTEGPTEEGHYDIYAQIADGAYYYGKPSELVGTFSIYRFDENEWQTLSVLLAELQQMGVTLPWDMTGGAKNVGTFEELAIREGHIVGISLANKDLNGLFPASLAALSNLKELDLSGNNLSGNIPTALAAIRMQNATAFNSLHTLNLSKNEYIGNVAILGNCLPSLSSLNVSYNKFEDLYPALPANVVNLDVTHQEMDRIVDLNLSELSFADMATKVPSILLYNHDLRGYSTSINLLCTKADVATFNKYNTDEWAMQLAVSDNQLSIPYVSSQNAYFGKSSDVLNVLNMTGNDSTDGSTFKIALSFNLGDANFDGQVNVLDLQTMINFIVENYQDRPYNFTASNLWSDEQMNVQDVICMVNLLLDSTENSEYGQARAKRVSSNEFSDATVYIQNGTLKINSAIPVSAFDFTIAGTDYINIADNALQNIEICQKAVNNGVRIIGYTMTGSAIGVGEITIGNTDANATLKNVMLSDSDAQPIKASMNQVLTDILHIGTNENGTIMYDMQGRRIQETSPNTIYINNDRKKIINR